jgi:glycosyltransferase involved in cell wall biosynthesis
MAMGKPVVASAKAMAGIRANTDKDVFLADTPDEFAAAVYSAAMTSAGAAVGRNARDRVMSDYRWSTSLERLDAVVNA